MRTTTFFSAGSARPAEIEDRTAVVIDVVRATTTIVTALAGGARAVYPAVSTEEALKLASSLGRDDVLLCGERDGLRIEGFDLGNSPAEYTGEVVGDKQLVMTTTNGTRAFRVAADAERILTASFPNLRAVVHAAADVEELVVICAGREDRFSLDDAVCAGRLLTDLRERAGAELELDDAGRAAIRLAEQYRVDEAFLRGTGAGRALVEVGLESDLSLCVERDRYDFVPQMENRMIRLPRGSGDPEA